MIRERDDRCTYRCRSCGNEFMQEPIGPLVRLEQCPMCQELTTQVRDFTGDEVVTVHEMLAAWRLEYGAESEDAPIG